MEIHQYDVPDDIDIENDGKTPDRPITNVVPPKRRRNWRKIVLITLVVLVVAALIALAILLLEHKKAAAPATTNQTNQTNAHQSLPTPTTPTTSGITTYTSPADNFNLSFQYPSSWTVTPPSGQSGQTITVTSPLVSITDATGASVPGKITLTVQAGGSSVGQIGSGQATVAQDSVQYAYDAPTAAQHHYFYISFLHLQAASSSTKGAFEVVVITGINTLTKGSTVTADTFGSVDPLVTAGFSKCSTEACIGTGAAPLSVNAAAWQTDPNLKQLQTLFESFKFN